MELAEVAPFNKLLGLKVRQRSPDRSEAELTVREELCNRRGVLHGGAVMALGDTLGGMTASSSLPVGGRTATIESKTNFFAAVHLGDTASAVCIPLHRGRTTCGSGDPDHARRWKACGYCHPDAAALRAKRMMAHRHARACPAHPRLCSLPRRGWPGQARP